MENNIVTYKINTFIIILITCHLHWSKQPTHKLAKLELDDSTFCSYIDVTASEVGKGIDQSESLFQHDIVTVSML